MIYPEHERLKRLKTELRIDMLGRVLDELAACGISYDLIHVNDPLKDKFVPDPEDRLAFERFLDWVDENIEHHCIWPDDGWGAPDRWTTLFNRPFSQDAPVYPSETLFAAYAGVNLHTLDDEKRAMLDELRSAEVGTDV